MCQLLGMNCNVPTDICFSFTGFCARGGGTDIHQDGWGIAFFEDRGCRVFLDPRASIASPIADLVRRYPIRSRNVVAHIRKATQGQICLENTHPFQRELWGRHWIFAHNGNLEHFDPALDGSVLPVGSTDSERAFCYLVQCLRQRFPQGAPARETLLKALAAIIGEVAPHGPFNFLLSNGEWLIAHCATKLHYVQRKAPFSHAHLSDEDVSVDFRQLTTPEDRVVVVATLPLTTNETWTALTPGELLLFAAGEEQVRVHLPWPGQADA